MDVNTIAWAILLLPLIVAASILLGLKRWSGVSSLVSTGSALFTLILTIILAGGGGDGAEIQSFPWIDLGDSFRVDIGLKIDGLSRGMMLIVTTVGFLVHLFSLGYMENDPGKSRYF